MDEFVRLRVKAVRNNTCGRCSGGVTGYRILRERGPPLAGLFDRLQLASQCRHACDDVIRRATAEQRVEAEAATGGIYRELHVHDREKHVIPRPFGRMAIEAEPEVQ